MSKQPATDLRLQSWINSFRQNGQALSRQNSDSRAESSYAVEWDFSDAESESEFTGSTSPKQNRRNPKPGRLPRQGSISFAEEDEVVEYATAKTEKPRKKKIKRQLSKSSSFDWDFGDDPIPATASTTTAKATPADLLPVKAASKMAGLGDDNVAPSSKSIFFKMGGSDSEEDADADADADAPPPPSSMWPPSLPNNINDNDDDNNYSSVQGASQPQPTLRVAPRVRKNAQVVPTEDLFPVKAHAANGNDERDGAGVGAGANTDRVDGGGQSPPTPTPTSPSSPQDLLIVPQFNRNGQLSKTLQEQEQEELLKADHRSPLSAEHRASHDSIDSNASGNGLGFRHREPAQNLKNLKRYISRTSLQSMREKMTVPKLKETGSKNAVNLCLAFLFVLSMGLMGLAEFLHQHHQSHFKLFPQLRLEEHERRILVFDKQTEERVLLEGHLAVTLPDDVHPYPCVRPNKGKDEHKDECLEWKDLARLRVAYARDEDKGINCYSFSWQSLSADVSPMDCFSVGPSQGHWYGGGESLHASWPLENGQIALSPFVTGDEGQTEWGNAIKKYFLNSHGVSVTVEDETPLFVSLNDEDGGGGAKARGLCIQAKFDDFTYYYHRFDLPRLNYTVCSDDRNDLGEMHRHFLPDTPTMGGVAQPQRQRDVERVRHLLQKPVWQVPAFDDLSHAQLKTYIDKVVGQEKERSDMGYLLLNYKWQKNMGDLAFNQEAFPNINETLALIRRSGLRLVLTLNPFVSTESFNFKTGVDQGLFVGERNASKNLPALTWFKDVNSAGQLDVTHNDTVTWLKSRLTRLMAEMGLQSGNGNDVQDHVFFYVDGGNTFHTPTYFQFRKPLDNPDFFRDLFVSVVMEEVPVIGVSGASSSRPRAPAFIFLSPLDSTWPHLQSIVPNMLQLSVIGYPFVNPGPVGGMGGIDRAGDDGHGVSLDRELELYIRWWQLNTFLPMLHFHKPPSAFPMRKISRSAGKLSSIRSSVVLPALATFSDEALSTSVPVIRPLWMLAPGDPVAQRVNDQFLIGDQILVAPVLAYGQRARDVYLPRGDDDGDGDGTVWRSGVDGALHQGGQWLNGTKVDLDDVLYFVRQTEAPIPIDGKSPETIKREALM